MDYLKSMGLEDLLDPEAIEYINSYGFLDGLNETANFEKLFYPGARFEMLYLAELMTSPNPDALLQELK